MYTQERADITGWSAWHVDDSPEGERWMLAYDQNFTEVRAEAVVKTTKTRKTDITGRNASGYRWSTVTEITLGVRVGYRGDTYTLKDPLVYYAGRKSAIRQVLRWVAGDGHLLVTKMEMDWAAHLRGASDLERLDCWDEDRAVELRNLWRLLEQYPVQEA